MSSAAALDISTAPGADTPTKSGLALIKGGASAQRSRSPESKQQGTADEGAGQEASVILKPQTAKDFLTRKFPPQIPLLEGVLSSQDLVALVGRRRHGKTTFIGNLLWALTLPEDNFLGYRIPEARRVIAFLLEGTSRELQDMLQKMLRGREAPEGLHVYTQEDFLNVGVLPDIADKKFRRMVEDLCALAKPDLICFDNLGWLIGADYTSHTKIHELIQFVRYLANTYDAAILVAAHPRKKANNDFVSIGLRDNPQQFFEECLGPSHFVNSMGNNWGIERSENGAGEQTYLLLGAQRRAGTYGFTTVGKDDYDWFQQVSDFDANLKAACNTQKREEVWSLLTRQTFTTTEALARVKERMGRSAFLEFLKELKRLGLVRPTKEDENTYITATKETYNAGGGEGERRK